MPAKILKKVRSLMKPKSAEAAPASPQPPPPAPAPTPAAAPAPAPVEAAPRKTRARKSGADAMPEPLRKAKEARATGQTEEWRPSRSKASAPASSGDANPEPTGDKPRRRRRRKPAGERAPRDQAPSQNPYGRSERSRKPRKPREDRAPTPSRGKGFAFPRPKAEHGDWDPGSYIVPEKEGKIRFPDTGVSPELLHAVSDLGYQYCTPIQAEILPALLEGRDGLGQAQTGTGKTAAFLLASFTHMLRNPRPNRKNGAPRVLIVAPTRELVLQIEEEAAEIGKYTPFQTLPVYGGLDFEAQKDALMDNVVDLVAATPGRLIDFLRKKVVDLSSVEILVLDEADRMLDMGFIPDVKRIVYATPHKDKRQTLFFSATFTDDVRRLAESWTRDAVSVVIEPKNVAADTVDQTVYIVTDDQKFPLTVNLLRNVKPSRCLIFANRRDSAQYLCDRLKDYEFTAALLTGAVPQAKRVKTLEAFKEGKIPILVATDVAGRGIHVEDVGLVINFNLPEDAEDYVHRIGRTGRAGAEGKSVCFADEMDAMLIPDMEKFLGRELSCTHPDDNWLEIETRDRVHHKQRRENERGSSGGGRRGGGGPRRGGGGQRSSGRGRR